MLKCCLSPDLALKQPMPFLSPPHVPALFTYPTTPGIVKVYVSFVEILSWYRDSLYLTERLCKPGFVFLVLHHIFMCWLDSDVTFRASRASFSFVFLSGSAKVCEEKLRYAAYNCVAIDTDMSPWEEWSLCCFIEQTLWMEKSCQVYHNNISWMPINPSCI